MYRLKKSLKQKETQLHGGKLGLKYKSIDIRLQSIKSS